ncbi:MAG: diguanylate cyclase [Sideroxyarcus sp.]|nr:diguanylate cyclase [Sideroxyarcus sp.]
MSPAQQQILSKLKTSGQLPTPKGIALRVIKLTQQSNVSHYDLVRLIGTDPSLSQRVVKAANALLGHVSRPVVKIHDAVTVLGLRALRQLVLGIALIADYRHGPCANFDYLHFWRHSLLTALTVRQLAQQARLMAVEEVFVLGLLGQIGQLVLATVYPQAFSDLLRQHETEDSLCEGECAQFGFDHAEVTAAMLADMHFPPLFQALTRDYRTPQASKTEEGTREWQLLRTLNLAGLLADVWLAGDAAPSHQIRAVRCAAAGLAIEESELLGMAAIVARDGQEWSSLLGMGRLHLPELAPLFSAHEASAATSAPLPYAHSAHDYKMRVLVVEDDRAIRALLEQWLSAAGHRVSVAEDGIAALNMAELHQPQVLIADWNMPRMDGIALSRELRRMPQHRDVYLIVVAADTSPDKLVEAFEAGVDDCLLKPLVPKLFFARLRAAQRIVQLQEELAFEREQMVHFSNELSSANQRLQQQALTDALTDLPNRRFAMERLEQEWALTRRGDRALSCMMLDIDHFKSINDRFGHQLGDVALQQVADALRKTARVQDVVCRYGGEEFLVICPDSGAEAAYQAAERMRIAVESLRVPAVDGHYLPLTISIGVAQKEHAMNEMSELVNCADDSLYAAKTQGRNRTVVNS